MSSRSESGLSAAEFAAWWEATGEHELRQVLYWRWDPIGVADLFPNTADEYDGYAPQVVSALREGASDEELAALLRRLELGPMGLSRLPIIVDHAGLAALLRSWFDASQDSWRKFGPVRR